MTMQYGEVRGCSEDIAELAEFADPIEIAAIDKAAPTRRIALDPDKVEQGLAQLVLSLIELVRRLLEKQALRRIDGGRLNPVQVETLGLTLMRLEEQMDTMKRHFGVDDLNLDLGPLGKLYDD
jgi:hypothetical protein